MKKAEQAIINDDVINVYNDLTSAIDKYGLQPLGRLRNCNAKVYRTFGYYVLVSYNTVVAAIDNDNRLYDFLRYVYGYTATSAQHIAKFRNDYGGRFCKVVRYYPT